MPRFRTEKLSELRKKRDTLNKIVGYLEKKIKTKKRSVADDLLLEKLAKLVDESPDLIPDLLPDNIESKEEMGKMIAEQLTEISPVLEKDNLENAIGSNPILVLHPHIGDDADNHRTNSRERPTKEKSLLEKLAKFIADKPDLIHDSSESAPEISSAEVEKATSVEPSNNPGDNNGQNIDNIIAGQISDISPVLEKDELEKAIKSLPILVLPPKNSTDQKSDIGPESFPDASENPDEDSDKLDRGTSEIDTFVEKGDKFSGKNLDLYDELVKEGHQDHAHALNLLIKGNEHDGHSNAGESIIDTSMSIKQNEVEHPSHLDYDENEARKPDVAKIDGKETGSDSQTSHVHFKGDLENPDEFIYEREQHKDHKHFYNDVEKDKQSVNKEKDHKHFYNDVEKDKQSVNKEKDHKHLDDNVKDIAKLIPEPSKNHQHIVEDLENQSDNKQQIDRKKYHKHVDENVDELADFAAEQSQNKEHHHISDDLENDEKPQINRKQHHKHIDDGDIDDLAEFKAEQQQNHHHLTKAYDSNDGPVFDEVVDFSGVSAILEESSDIIFGKELSSTPTTLALQLLLQRDTLSTSVK